jgi:hypothetical protein
MSLQNFSPQVMVSDQKHLILIFRDISTGFEARGNRRANISSLTCCRQCCDWSQAQSESRRKRGTKTSCTSCLGLSAQPCCRGIKSLSHQRGRQENPEGSLEEKREGRKRRLRKRAKEATVRVHALQQPPQTHPSH